MNARLAVAVTGIAFVALAVVLLARPAHPVRMIVTNSTVYARVGTSGRGETDPRVLENGARNGPAQEPREFTASGQCAACHAEVYEEWRSSFHAQAWTDPMVQALTNGFRMSECIDCHAPLPIHLTGVDQRVAPRKHLRSDGVDCLSCHLLADGVSVAASRTIDTSKSPGACRPVATPVMKESMVCAGCHNQHETINELEASAIGKTCQDCHMEPAPRGVGAPGKGHRFPGAHSVEMHRRAAKLEVRVEAGVVIARVSNVGAGHHIPTDARHRSYNLWITVRDPQGNVLVSNQPMADGEFRLYYRSDFRPSTQIAHGDHREAAWRVPGGVKGKAEVRLTYALNPEELARGIVIEVARIEVDL